ncbi:MAG: carbohydrate ABC transporter permease [Treponema sp.]|jgi:putative aldouronate transport system permease protein|nr:carbohydrate ABC transporter permease [Treponema sp.]
MIKKDRLFNFCIHTVLILLTIFTLLPLSLMVISSFTDETAILQNGYSFLPRQWSTQAYRYLRDQSDYIFNAVRISVLVTVIGTFCSLMITCMLAYPLSRRDFPLRRPLSFFVFFTLLFNGGLVPTYLIYTQVFHIKDTFFGLIVPSLLMNGFTVILVRTFFMTNIPESIIESARIDGAGEFKIFFKIVMPLSLPILATVSLMSGLNYWNDWYNGFIYITNTRLFSLQNILNRMLQDVQFLQSNSSMGGSLAQEIAKIPTTTVRMAIAAVGALPILVAYPFFQKYFVKGIVIGAVKG